MVLWAAMPRSANATVYALTRPFAFGRDVSIGVELGRQHSGWLSYAVVDASAGLSRVGTSIITPWQVAVLPAGPSVLLGSHELGLHLAPLSFGAATINIDEGPIELFSAKLFYRHDVGFEAGARGPLVWRNDREQWMRQGVHHGYLLSVYAGWDF